MFLVYIFVNIDFNLRYYFCYNLECSKAVMTSSSAHESDTDLSSVGLGGEEFESALEAIIELLDVVHSVGGVVASLFRLL